MALNKIFTPKDLYMYIYSRSLSRLTYLILIGMMLCLGVVDSFAGIGKFKPPCSIGGVTTVNPGDTKMYQLVGECANTATSWTVSCGAVQSSTSAYANIYFNGLSCTSATITAKQGSTVLATLTVTIVQPLSAGSIGNQSINYGTAPSLLSGAASGGTCGTSYTYQWYSSTDGTNYTTISGATGASYQPAALTVSTWYKMVVTCSGSTAFTTCKVTVYPQLVGGVVSPATQGGYSGTVPSILSISAPSGGSGAYGYQWYSSPNGSTWTLIGGATGSSYAPPALTATIYYRCVVSSNGATATSNTATITLYPPLQAGTISPATQTADYMVPATSPITLSGYSGGSGIYTSAWESSSDPAFTNPVIIANDILTSLDPYIFLRLRESAYFRVKISSGGMSVYTNTAVINVNAQLFGGIITPSSITLTAANTAPGIITALPPSGGGCGGNYSYQWQSGPDSANFTDIPGATNVYYDPGNVSSKTYYRRKATCGAISAYTNTCRVTINAAMPDLNYVRQRIITKPGVTDTTMANALTSPTDVRESTTYLDGLGRPLEDVQKQASPLLKDIVNMHVYDFFGRESSKYLPYVSTSSDGAYKINPMGDQSSFNATQYPNEHFYYAQQRMESSCLNRPESSYSPGKSWIESNRGTSVQYSFNATTDSVQNWTISSAAGSTPVRVAAYPAGRLYKTVVTDEAAHKMVEYKNPLGKTILKKTQVANNPGNGHFGWLCTYYVYDTLQNLRFIIQPKAVDSINGTWTLSASMIKELCFRYEYDGRGRVIVKKTPGAGENYIVYDARDRIVMLQDSAIRAQGKWSVIKYDGLNRPDSTGVLTDNNNRAYHQNLAYSAVGYPSTVSNFELLSAIYYDDYGWISSSGTSFAPTMATNKVSNSNYFVTTPGVSPVYASSVTPNYQTRGLPTGTRTKIVGTASQYLYSVSFYDDRRRVLQTQSINYTGAVDTITYQYGFNGNVIRTLLGHKKAGNTIQNHTLSTKVDYDAGMRIRRVWKNIDDAAADQLIDSIQYNELGQVKAKFLGSSLDSLVYDYNIRGWLTNINKNYLTGTYNHYFGMELAYDKTASVMTSTTYTQAAYNGNAAGSLWKSAGDGVGRKYDYAYDNANRLTAASFTQNTSGSTWDSSYINFSVSNLKYDANGNILSMNQAGFKVGGSALIDQMVYTYKSNKLVQVSDAVNDVNSKLGDLHYNPATKGAFDYTYDGNGNLISDNNRNIDGIVYNYMNLPQQVHMNTKGNILYTYDANGIKLKKVIMDSVSRRSTTTIYVSGFVYQQIDTITAPGAGVDTLQFFTHEEGRARWAYHKYLNGTSAYKWEYDFYEKDHLGNPRILLTQQKDTAQYLASMEAAYRATENKLFYNLTNTGYARNLVGGYPVDTSITNPNDSLARVNGSGNKVGPGVILKVMSGDKVDIAVQSYYNNIVNSNTPNSSINDILASLATGVVSMTGGTHGTLGELNTTTSPMYNALNVFQGANNPTPSGKPKAYLNWILLDDQFKYVSSYPQSGATPVGTANQINTLGYTGIPITKSGYLYVYVSNETPGWDAFFDNLTVKQYSGPMLEETHYYPFGLTMAGISDKAIKTNYAENKKKFNEGSELQNQEFSDGTGLETYETSFRSYDPQIGRFQQIDPLAGKSNNVSPYAYCLNNPVLSTDPEGLDSDPFGDIINHLLDPNDKYGGQWTSDGGYMAFGSDDEAFGYAAAYLSATGGWGSTVVGSFENALNKWSNGQATVGMATAIFAITWQGQATGVRAWNSIENRFGISGVVNSTGNPITDYFVSPETVLEMYRSIVPGNPEAEKEKTEIFTHLQVSFETMDVTALKLAETGFESAARISGTASFTAAKWYVKGGKIAGRMSSGVGILNAGLAIGDMVVNGPSIHSGIDVTVGIVSAICPIFGLVYGIADIGSVIFTHKTISEHIEHAIK